MIAAIYARKSTEQAGVSEEEKSVTRQIEHAKAYALKKGWTLDDALVFVDDGISGAEFGDRRPGLERLLGQLKPRPPFQVVIVSEESRLGRESIEVSSLLKQLSVAGVVVYCYLDDKAVRLDTPTDEVMVALRGFTDESERTRASQRTHDALARKARAGHVTGGRCFGYTNVNVTASTPDAHGRPIRLYVERRINEAQAAVVRKIFRLYTDGHGLGTIARRLNDEGVPSPHPLPGRPAGWVPGAVRQVLLRPIYRGEIIWNRTKKRDLWGRRRQQPRADETAWIRTPAEQLRLVSDDVWHAAHARLQEMRATGGLLLGRPLHGIESKYLLTGMAACALCKPNEEASYGGSLTIRTRHRAFFYACTCHVLRGQRACQNGLHLPMEATHRAVWEALKRDLFQSEVLLYAVEKAIAKAQETEASDTGQDAALQGQLQTVEQELARLSIAIATGGELPTLLAASQEREQRRAHLRQAVTAQATAQSLGRLDLRLLDRELRTKIADWTTLLDSIGGNVALARQLLRKLVSEKLVFTPDLAARTCAFVGRSTVGRVLYGLVPAKGLVSPKGMNRPLMP
jgi:site-specific DNA recombinase